MNDGLLGTPALLLVYWREMVLYYEQPREREVLAALQLAVEPIGIGKILVEHRLRFGLSRELAAVVEIFLSLGFILFWEPVE
jgi:hypothetical protein